MMPGSIFPSFPHVRLWTIDFHQRCPAGPHFLSLSSFPLDSDLKFKLEWLLYPSVLSCGCNTCIYVCVNRHIKCHLERLCVHMPQFLIPKAVYNINNRESDDLQIHWRWIENHTKTRYLLFYLISLIDLFVKEQQKTESCRMLKNTCLEYSTGKKVHQPQVRLSWLWMKGASLKTSWYEAKLNAVLRMLAHVRRKT